MGRSLGFGHGLVDDIRTVGLLGLTGVAAMGRINQRRRPYFVVGGLSGGIGFGTTTGGSDFGLDLTARSNGKVHSSNSKATLASGGPRLGLDS
jgi:hypothetical protein